MERTKPVYYTIGQVAEILELPQSVLRYWETVFEPLQPLKSSGGNRQYSDKDVELLEAIKSLLYEEGFTIRGARQQLQKKKALLKSVSEEKTKYGGRMTTNESKKSSNTKKHAEQPHHENVKAQLSDVIAELKSIVKILQSD